ncbi:hypothetical protein ACFYT4_27575 [Streptomyces sp. NPDC004609]|uniref:hypothetical protein n=1 Tax=Streptomyces sp. NPDC004609 TaxID=3364704 RepID=UPI003687D58F
MSAGAVAADGVGTGVVRIGAATARVVRVRAGALCAVRTGRPAPRVVRIGDG